jgi:succinylglutamate desuccinylase
MRCSYPNLSAKQIEKKQFAKRTVFQRNSFPDGQFAKGTVFQTTSFPEEQFVKGTVFQRKSFPVEQFAKGLRSLLKKHFVKGTVD